MSVEWEGRSPEYRARKAARKAVVVAQRRLELQEYKLALGCARCGYNEDARALDFDHRDRTKKLFNIMQTVDRSPKLTWDEVAKCDVLCANCHRIKTYESGDNKAWR